MLTKRLLANHILRLDFKDMNHTVNELRMNLSWQKAKIGAFFDVDEAQRKKELEIRMMTERAGGPINYFHMRNEREIRQFNKRYEKLGLPGYKLFAKILEDRWLEDHNKKSQ